MNSALPEFLTRLVRHQIKGDHGTLQIPLGARCVGRGFWPLLHQGRRPRRVVWPPGSSDY